MDSSYGEAVKGPRKRAGGPRGGRAGRLIYVYIYIYTYVYMYIYVCLILVYLMFTCWYSYVPILVCVVNRCHFAFCADFSLCYAQMVSVMCIFQFVFGAMSETLRGVGP